MRKFIFGFIISIVILISLTPGCKSNNPDDPNGWLETRYDIKPHDCDTGWNEFFSFRNYGDTTYVTILIDSSDFLCKASVQIGKSAKNFGGNVISSAGRNVTSATIGIADTGIVNFYWGCVNLDTLYNLYNSCHGIIKLFRRNKIHGNIFWGKRDTLKLISYAMGGPGCDRMKYFHTHINKTSHSQKILVKMKNSGDCTFKVIGKYYVNGKAHADTIKLAGTSGPNQPEKWGAFKAPPNQTINFFVGCSKDEPHAASYCGGFVSLYLAD